MACIGKPWVSTRMWRFLPLIFLPASKPGGSIKPLFFCAFDALAVDDRGRRAVVSASLLPASDVERMMDAFESTIMAPAAEIVVHRAARRQVLWQRRPLATCAENSPLTISRITTVRLLPPRLAGGISEEMIPIPRPSNRWDSAARCGHNDPALVRPHPEARAKPYLCQEFTSDSKDSRCSRMDI